MINLIKTENLNLGILETDFDIYADIINTFDDPILKEDCLVDLEDYLVPKYFSSGMTLAIQSNEMLIGYVMFKFSNNSNSINVDIDELVVLNEFKNKNMEAFLIEGVLYIAGEIGTRNVSVKLDKSNNELIEIYKKMGFYLLEENDNNINLTVNVNSIVTSRKLNEKFRDIPNDYVDYKSLTLNNKIAQGRSSSVYLTSENEIFKMFSSTSFTYIKDREQMLKRLMKLNINEVVKPKKLVYYNGVFVGYIMDYIPNGKSLSKIEEEGCKFEDKIDKIRKIEVVMQKLHNEKIYVCDLNPDNILFDENNNVHFIDCDSFVIKKNVINTSVDKKFIDPFNKIVSERTDLYAFSVTIMELLLGVKIEKNMGYKEICDVYNINKSKLPVSFKSYFDEILNKKERLYLSESYENYVSQLYDGPVSDDILEQKSGKASVVVLIIMVFVVAIIGYLFIKYSR